jgi:glycosidase
MRTLLSLLTLGALMSCGSTPEALVESTNRAPHALPWHPIALQPDSTWVPVSDFLLAHESLERATWEDGSGLEVVEGQILIDREPEFGLGFLQLWVNGEPRDVPVLRSRLQRIDYELGPFYEDLGVAQLKGSFTGWAPVDLGQPDGRNRAVFHLPPGDHTYQVRLKGEWQAEYGVRQQPNGFGAFNSILSVPAPGPAPELVAERHEPGDHVNDIVLTGTPGARLFGWWENHLYASVDIDSTGSARVRVPAAAYGKKRSHLRLWAANEQGVSKLVLLPLESGVPIEDPSLLTRDDRQAMIMYFLMIDRFVNGDETNDDPVDDPRIQPRANHHGGDFAGLEQAVERGYFEELGVNTVWVSPIVANPDSAFGWWSDPSTDVTSAFSGYHGYWPIRSTVTDRRFGSMEAFHAVVETAHYHGLNVLVDYVANHVHQEHPVYQQHPDWATSLYLPDGRENTQLWDEQRLTTWFDTFMPTLDFSRPEVVDAMTDSAVWWIQHSEIDGFRHDATKHIPEAFWRSLTAKIKAETGDERNVFQIGETYGSPELINSYLSSGMIDAQFDFNHYDALVAAFADDSASVEGLVSVAEQSLDTYGAHHLMGNITGNQDRPRFTSLADGSLALDEDTKLAGWTRTIEHNGAVGYEKMQLLTAYLFSVPGVPCFYYGDEYADVGGNDPDNRKMMRFELENEDEQRTWDHAARWAHLRAERMSLMYGDTEYEVVDRDVVRIERRYLGEVTEVWINKGSEAKNVHIEGQLLVGALETGMLAGRSAVAVAR